MEKRNTLGISDYSQFLFKTPGAKWNSWTIEKSVRDGYKASGWVYRAISIISQNAAIPPMVVFNSDNEMDWEHPLSILLKHPNPKYNMNLITRLLASWLNLSGEGYIYKNVINGKTMELWPISPDTIEPYVISPDGLQIGYSEITTQGRKKSGLVFTNDNMISIMFPDPANPLRGIGPLQVAARAVDTDNEQTEWNKSAMQNRGVIDGLFSFDKLIDETNFEFIKRKIREHFSGSSNARNPLPIGGGVKYQQIALGPIEMDFLNSRKFNREEIFIIFGVPPQIAGITDSMTYNTFAEGSKVLWEMTIIPLLNTILEAFNYSFNNELEEGFYIGFDYSNVKALKRGEGELASTAKTYIDMGVPFARVNKKFELGIEEYDGWDLPVQSQSNPQVRSSKSQTKRIAQVRDKLAETTLANRIAELLEDQKKVVIASLEAGSSMEQAIKDSRPLWDEEMARLFRVVSNRVKEE